MAWRMLSIWLYVFKAMNGWQLYLSLFLVWLVRETAWEEADDGEKEDSLWLNNNSMGTTDTCPDEVQEGVSMFPKQAWK